ncbi:hypothetical protein N0V93_008419 [Gnomoniopsis smithogilvyi]|uniref:Uncharacterized protein n=1 Tax=Gnomoniopsis smithogilvyi TaxID=1191159 RepID=A0A9W8YN49_9PEZI|nr:hypothetical protein N0V93_008419 [Gnomoniopsis smithogilvyi]
MATWDSKPGDSWSDDGEFEAATSVVDLDYANTDGIIDGIDGPVEEEKKPQRIRKKDIEQLQNDREDEKEKFISVWQRAGKNQPLIEFMPKFSRGAAAVFSDVWNKQLAGNAGALIIEDDYVEPYKRILEWIDLCVEEGNDVKFPEIANTDNALHLLLDIINVADRLKIPEMSLQAHLKKTAIKYARYSLIDIEYIERIYDEHSTQYLGMSEPLREAAAASIFENWWNGVLDDPDYDDYCSYLEQMRAKFPKLDEDVNKRFDDKKEYIIKKREEKREERRQARVGGHNGYRGNSAADYPEANGPDGGWRDALATVGEDNAGEWNATVAGVAGPDVGTGEWGLEEAKPIKTSDWAEVVVW